MKVYVPTPYAILPMRCARSNPNLEHIYKAVESQKKSVLHIISLRVSIVLCPFLVVCYDNLSLFMFAKNFLILLGADIFILSIENVLLIYRCPVCQTGVLEF